MVLVGKLDQVVNRHKWLAEQMSTGTVPPEEFAKLSKEYADLAPIVEKAKEFNSLMDELEGANELLTDPDTDNEMRMMAEEEVRAIQEKLPELTESIQKLLYQRMWPIQRMQYWRYVLVQVVMKLHCSPPFYFECMNSMLGRMDGVLK